MSHTKNFAYWIDLCTYDDEIMELCRTEVALQGQYAKFAQLVIDKQAYEPDEARRLFANYNAM